MSKASWQEDMLAKCPFYVHHSQTIIVCESPLETEETTNVLYTTPKSKKSIFMDKYCRNMWQTCPIARAINRKYEGDES